MRDMIEAASAAYVETAIAEQRARDLKRRSNVLFLELGRATVDQLNLNCCRRGQNSAHFLQKVGRAICDAAATD